MALLGKAAMILSFDIAPEAVVEHDHWHSREHLHERMSIPGFLRGSRWTSMGGGARYFVMYEVSDVDVLSSPRYLERLNNPTPWTVRMMKHYRGMRRGLCRVTFSRGYGLGGYGLVVRFGVGSEQQDALRRWLAGGPLNVVPETSGLVSAHLFEAAIAAEITAEQRIRGRDDGLDWALLITGHDQNAVSELAANALSGEKFVSHGGMDPVSGIFRMGHFLSKEESAVSEMAE